MIEYVSDFNSVVSRLESMEVTLHEDLLVAILLRGLPSGFAMFVAALKHRERIPPLEEVIGMLCAEEQGRPGAEVHVGEGRCSECNRAGHTSTQCWDLHPELAPVCKACKKKGHSQRSCPNKSRSAESAAAEYPIFEEGLPISL